MSNTKRIAEIICVTLTCGFIFICEFNLVAYAKSKPSISIGPDQRVIAHKLESIELKGSTRTSIEDLQEELGLKTGMPLDDKLVMNTRQKLLSLGLFRSAILYQRKGSKRGLAHLIIEVEDDDTVLTDWAVGGSLAVTQDQDSVSTLDPDTPPLGYRIGLLGRNFFSSMHRGSALIDIDSEGHIREGRIAYGLPRFTREDVQFDTEVTAVDVKSRYLNAQGFGARVQGVWTSSLGASELQYGPAMYVNRKPRFAVGKFPESVAGPKVGYIKETRLNRFFPGEGYSLGASLLGAVTRFDYSILEFQGAYTFSFFKLFWTSFELKALTVGVKGYSLRGENRYDIPLGSVDGSSGELAELFLRLRAGSDEFEEKHLTGTSAILGLRYHSSGFIAEFGFRITKSPKEFLTEEIEKVEREAL